MLKDINDSDDDARALIKLLEGIPSKVNLIPFNKWPGVKYERSSNNRIRAFSKIIEDGGYSSPVRTPRGEDILAACGQLKSESIRVKKSLDNLPLPQRGGGTRASRIISIFLSKTHVLR
jgi:23S rRNA (adenine2503-C2)-methyltransferase